MRLNPAALTLVGLVSGGVLWAGFNLLMGVSEPWDHSLFWLGYLIAMIDAAVLGALASSSAWLAGVAVILSMLPVMALFSEIGPLLIVGLVLLVGLSIPAALSALAGQYFAQRVRG